MVVRWREGDINRQKNINTYERLLKWFYDEKCINIFLISDRDNPTHLHIESKKGLQDDQIEMYLPVRFNTIYVLLGPKLNVKMNKTN